MSTAIVWHRNDLRIRDHEALSYAAEHHDVVIPVYCFDPRQFATTMFDLPKTGPIRARFLRESVADLRDSLQDLGADLVVRHAKPENALPELIRATGATDVYMFEEVGTEEKEIETAVENALADTDARPAYFWGKSLYHLDDAPFDAPDDVPDVFTPFRKKLQ